MAPHKGDALRHLRLWVKYCGGCNPHIDRAELVQQVMAILQEDGQAVDLAYPGDSLPLPPDGVLLVVSGCPSDCASRPADADRYPTVLVAGTTLGGRPVPPDALPRKTAAAIIAAVARR